MIDIDQHLLEERDLFYWNKASGKQNRFCDLQPGKLTAECRLFQQLCCAQSWRSGPGYQRFPEPSGLGLQFRGSAHEQNSIFRVSGLAIQWCL